MCVCVCVCVWGGGGGGGGSRTIPLWIHHWIGPPVWLMFHLKANQCSYFSKIPGVQLFMPRSHIHGSPRRFHYGSTPTDDPGNDNFRSPIRMHNASTTTYDCGCTTKLYRLIRIAAYDAGSYPWLILRQIRECVTWALQRGGGVRYCDFPGRSGLPAPHPFPPPPHTSGSANANE